MVREEDALGCIQIEPVSANAGIDRVKKMAGQSCAEIRLSHGRTLKKAGEQNMVGSIGILSCE
jgi:hypothetical protein